MAQTCAVNPDLHLLSSLHRLVWTHSSFSWWLKHWQMQVPAKSTAFVSVPQDIFFFFLGDCFSTFTVTVSVKWRPSREERLRARVAKKEKAALWSHWERWKCLSELQCWPNPCTRATLRCFHYSELCSVISYSKLRGSNLGTHRKSALQRSTDIT